MLLILSPIPFNTFAWESIIESKKNDNIVLNLIYLYNFRLMIIHNMKFHKQIRIYPPNILINGI